MSYNIFERWPFTSFQNLNLDWLMKATGEAKAIAQEAANTVTQYAARLLNVENKTAALETSDTQQSTKIAALETSDAQQSTKIAALETNDAQQDTDIYNASEAALTAQRDAATALQMANLVAENQMFTCVVNNTVSPVTSSKNYAALQSILVTQKKSINFIYIDPSGYEYETALVTTSSNKIRAIFILDRASSSDFYRVIYVDVLSDDSINISTDTIDTSGGGGTVQNGIFLITAVYANGQYTFDRNQSDILSAIVGGKLPVVRYHTTAGQSDYDVYHEWVFSYYGYDGEDVYIYFSRLDQYGNASIMQWLASTGKGTVVTRPTLPPATSADEGQVPMVNSFGNYQLVMPRTLPIVTAADNGKFLRVVNGAWAAAQAPTMQEITITDVQVQEIIDPNKFYVFPNPGQMEIVFGAAQAGVVNEYHFRFTSGSTATELSLPGSVVVPDDFDVVANTVYEISIIDNYMVYSSWAVSA